MNKKKKYLSHKKVRSILKTCNWLVLMGERSCGKSYAAKSVVIEDAINIYKVVENSIANNSMFIYLRRYDLDTKDSLCVSYFADLPVENMTKGEYTCIDVFRKGIYLANTDPETGKVTRGKKIGFCHALSAAEHYKSLQFPNVDYIIYEEFISRNGQYLYEEPAALQQYVSTIFRDRENGKVILIGNTISRICPYFSDYGFDKILLKQKLGTVEYLTIHNDNGNDTTIAVYLTDSANYNTGMFFGKPAQNITKGGYEVSPQPRLPEPVQEYKCIYKFVLQYNNLSFMLQLMQHKTKSDNIVWYCQPKTTPIQKNTRVVSNIFSTDPYYTRFLRGITQNEEKVFSMIRAGKICFSDDLCGTEFNNVLTNYLR